MKILGLIVFYGAGLVMWIFEIVWFFNWWGGVGVIGAVLLPPLAAIFPFLFLFMGGFSALYFGLWALGLVGLVVATAGDV